MHKPPPQGTGPVILRWNNIQKFIALKEAECILRIFLRKCGKRRDIPNLISHISHLNMSYLSAPMKYE